MTELGNCTFEYTSGLKQILTPKLESIHEEAFYDCDDFVNIVSPKQINNDYCLYGEKIRFQEILVDRFKERNKIMEILAERKIITRLLRKMIVEIS